MGRVSVKARRCGVTVAAVALATALAGCGDSEEAAEASSDLISEERCERNAAVGTIHYVSPHGFGAHGGILDIFMAEELGYYDDLCLDVEMNATASNRAQLVSTGRAHFTSGPSGSDQLLTNAQGADNIVAVGILADFVPDVVLANESIKDLKDLEGKTFAYTTQLSTTTRAMLERNDVDVDSIELINSDAYDAEQLTRGQIDAMEGFMSNQPLQLEAKGLPFTLFNPVDYGVDGTYIAYQFNKEFLTEHRDVAADVQRATLAAVHYCMDDAHIEECVDKLSELAEEGNQGDAFPRDQQLRIWTKEVEMIKQYRAQDRPLGVTVPEQWEADAALLLEYSQVDEDDLPAIEDVVDFDLIPSLYDGDELIWPGE